MNHKGVKSDPNTVPTIAQLQAEVEKSILVRCPTCKRDTQHYLNFECIGGWWSFRFHAWRTCRVCGLPHLREPQSDNKLPDYYSEYKAYIDERKELRRKENVK